MPGMAIRHLEEVELISIVPRQHHKNGLEDDSYIQRHGPVAQIIEVVLDTGFHFSMESVSPRKPFTWAQPVIPGFTLCRIM